MRQIGDVLRETLTIPIDRRSGQSSKLREEYACPKCKDAGYVRISAPVGDPNFARVIPCECRLVQQDERVIDELWKLSNLEGVEGYTFRDFDPEVEGVDEAFDAAKEYAETMDGWIFFEGGCGVGKTHLAIAIAKQVVSKNKVPVYFAPVPDLLDQLRSTFDPSHGVAYDDRFNQIRNCQLLVLDDLGTENATPWAREKLYQIVNFRYNERRATVITSNRERDELDERIYSRVMDTRLTRHILMHNAHDYRLQGIERLKPRTNRLRR